MSRDPTLEKRRGQFPRGVALRGVDLRGVDLRGVDLSLSHS